MLCQESQAWDSCRGREERERLVGKARWVSALLGPAGSSCIPLQFPQQELKLKDKECERLSKVREQLEQELEELTASLFEVPPSSFSHHFLS